jgi:AraC-like DNA-binding protein
MSSFLALLPDRTARARLTDAVRLMRRGSSAGYGLEFRDDWPQPGEAARELAGDVVVFDPGAGAELGVRSCARFRAAFPSAVLVAYGGFVSWTARDILKLAQAGVQQVVEMGVDDSPAVLSLMLEGALSLSLVGDIVGALRGHLPSDMLELVRVLLSHGEAPVTPVQAARLCHCHPKTLRDRLRKAGLPSTERMIVWVRLMAAAHRLGDPGSSLEDVATRLGFPSANGLRNQMRRYAGIGPRELSEKGGSTYVVESFLEQCAATRRRREAPLRARAG